MFHRFASKKWGAMLLAAAAIALVLSVSGALGSPANQQYSGCLKAGMLSSVAIGTSPAAKCVKPAVQITWSQTGPQGPPGTNGTNGFNSLTKTSSEPAGANCANGGQKVESGLDNGDGGGTANDGILQAGEVDATSFVCNGAVGQKGADGGVLGTYTRTVTDRTSFDLGGINTELVSCDPGDTAISGGFKQDLSMTLALQNSYPFSETVQVDQEFQDPPFNYPASSFTQQGWEIDVRTTSDGDLSSPVNPPSGWKFFTAYVVCEDTSNLPPYPPF